MKRRTVTALATLCLLAAPLHAQDLDEAAIARALKSGTDDKFGSWAAECRAEASPSERRAASGLIRRTGSYDVVLATNLGAIAFLAYQAKEGGKTLGVSDVPAWVLNRAVYVFIEPRKPPRDWGAPSSGAIPTVEGPSSIEEVLLNSKTTPASTALKPEVFETADASFSESRWLVSQLPAQVGPDGRLRPMVFERSRGRATFSGASVTGLPAGDLEIVIVTKDGERRCDIRARDRARLFP
jgi:hypothetical protein